MPFLFWQKGRIHHGRSDAGTLDFRSNGALKKGEISGNSFAAFFQSVRTCEPSSNAIWNAYLSHLAAAIRNVNTVIDSDVILSGFLVPYFTEADLKFLKQKITALPFFAERDIKIQLGKHDEFAPAIGAALPFVKRTIEEI